MFKKICALVLAIAMVLVMSSVAMAADPTTNTHADTYTGAGDTNATSVANGNVIPLTKSIVFVNANSSAVYEPNITYTYTVTPLTITDLPENTHTVNDGTHEGYVHPGVDDGVSGVSIHFGTNVDGTDTATVTTSPTGVDIERTANLTVDVRKFTKPGIYRYKITESSNPAAVTDAGLTARTTTGDNAYNADRYLDVYIHYVDDDNNATTPEVLKMYGAVIFKSTATTAGRDNMNATTTVKTTGYKPSAADNLKDDTTVDRYTTYDFSVKKTVSGRMADKKNEFPFYVNITNTITGAKYTYFDDPGTGNGDAETITGAAITKGTNAKTSGLALKDGEFVKFVGVPSNQTNNLTVQVTEYNNTYDKYIPSVTKTGTAGSITMTSTNAATGKSMEAQSGSDSTSSFDVKGNDAAGQIITIDNNLEEISPTGVVLRVAPYVLILGAGLALLLISRRRKTASEEE